MKIQILFDGTTFKLLSDLHTIYEENQLLKFVRNVLDSNRTITSLNSVQSSRLPIMKDQKKKTGACDSAHD